MDCNNVNKRILELCKQKGWTEYRLAKETNIPNSSINAMFKNNHVPSIYNLQKICNAFQITLSQFFNSTLFQQDVTTSIYIELWNQLSIPDKEKVLIYIYGLLHKEIRNDDLKDDLRRIKENRTTPH